MQGKLGLSPEYLAFCTQIPSISRCQSMYKRTHIRKLALTDFNQPIGLTMDPKNRWARLAAMIPWEKYEQKGPPPAGEKMKTTTSGFTGMIRHEALMFRSGCFRASPGRCRPMACRRTERLSGCTAASSMSGVWFMCGGIL